VPHQFYQLDSWLRMLQLNAAEEGLSWNLKAVPAAFLIHCYNQGVSPTVSGLEAYTHQSPERFFGGPVRLIRGGNQREISVSDTV
jgi:hypothetical protein